MSFKYNSDGIRTSKTVVDTSASEDYTVKYVLDGSKILRETHINNTTNAVIRTLDFFYDDTGVSGFTLNGTPYYYIKNLQGDVIHICSASGGIVATYVYDAWGYVVSTTAGVGQVNPFRYRGYYYDSESELYYLNSRYYDPQVGRFVNADGIVGANGGLQGYNMFAYCNNSPVMYVDPSGYSAHSQMDIFNSKLLGEGELTGPGGGGFGCSYAKSSTPALISAETKNTLRKLKLDIESFNLFNDDPNVALASNYFSFYKGVLVIRTDLKRSGSFGIIFLTRESNDRDNPEDIVRHEYGHVMQLLQLGVLNYALSIGIPSAAEWGDDDYYGDYYNKPFEVTADIYGGVQSRNHTFRNSYAGFKYLVTSAALGPIVWLSIE